MTIDLKKAIHAIDLAYQAGLKRQSPRTGFVHLSHQNPTAADTIPLYENFCFILSLFHQRTADTVTEGKELVDRLLAFQTPSGNFPIYLHDFPRAWDASLGLKIAPILVQILRQFGSVLGAEIKEKMESSIQKILRYSLQKHSEKPYSLVWENRLRALAGESLIEEELLTSEDWTEWVITKQLLHPEAVHFPIPYNQELEAFTGSLEGLQQEKGEPLPSPIEWVLADNNFSPRLLRDHPLQLHSAPILPFKTTQSAVCPFDLAADGKRLRLLWKGKTLHSLAIFHASHIALTETGADLFFDLPETYEPGAFEVAAFCDLSPETELFVNEQKATVFKLGDLVTIRTPNLTLKLVFEGEGNFCGHLSRANRPNQICKGYEAFDWQIGLRTLSRSARCQIKIFLKIN